MIILKLISNILNKKLIYNFRQNDLRFHNGQGAPLALIYHKLIIEDLSLQHNNLEENLFPSLYHNTKLAYNVLQHFLQFLIN